MTMNKKKYDGQLYQFPYVETLKEIIEASAARCPNRPAYMYKIEHNEPFRSMSYAAFNDARLSLGTALLELGLKGRNIAVMGENSHRWTMAYFTVVCGVGAIVPIDKGLEAEEIINLLNRADVAAVFVSPKSLNKVYNTADQITSLEHLIIMDESAEDVPVNFNDDRVKLMSELIERGKALRIAGNTQYEDAVVRPGDLSTILFTSGTTGLAKGVMLSHMNLAQNVFNMSKYFCIPSGGRVLSVLPMHHAYEMTCTVMTCFYQGACVVICEGLKHIQTNFAEAGCCVMLGVPLIYENMYRKIWKQAEKSGQADNLRRAIDVSKGLGFSNNKFVTRHMFKAVHSLFGPDFYEFIVGGAAIDPKVITDFEMMGLPMMQGYGMTENAPIIAMNTDRYGKAASAGKPMPGTEIRIVDKDENGIGEIICKGPSVMMGYYKDPENTAKTVHDGWLYTGDYGYFDEDGFLYITGRKKNVIVTKGGKNIFPEEVEYYLQLEPFVSEVMVYGKPDSAKDDLICTAIIYPNYRLLRDQGYTTDEQILEQLSQLVDRANAKMPPYKRVKRIEVRDKEFIKTTTLKIKRFEEGNYDYKFDSKGTAAAGRV
ncbi:MAG: AMP-binding protein [Mogibacterium sp.]|nr:AMP-binding protein [Mogibacterium sp.]